MEGFTPRQLEIHGYIQSQVAASGKAPTLREIMGRFGFSSLGTVQKHLLHIEKKSAIRRERYEHRGIRVLGAALAPTPA